MTPLKLDLHSLIVFYHVASEGSITAAAETMCLTQPTITYHVRSLEKNIGLKLLDIRRQKVSLTQAGTGLMQYVSEIHQQMAIAERYLENLKETRFRVGIAPTFSNCLVKTVSSFEKRYPQVKLVLRSIPSYEVIDDVLNSEVDLGIIVGTDEENPKLSVQPLSDYERLVLVASPENPITRRKHLSILNICGHPLVLGPETSATRRMILKQLSGGGCGLPAPIIVEVNNADWSLNLVENGQAVGFHHIRSVARPISEGRLKALPIAGEFMVRAEAITRSDTPEHPIAAGFISLVKKAFKEETCEDLLNTVRASMPVSG